LLVTVNVAVVALAATLTFDGTVAAAVLLLLKLTVVLLDAALVRATVPVEFPAPPVTLVGFNETYATVTVVLAGFTVSVELAEPFRVAVITGLACDVTD